MKITTPASRKRFALTIIVSLLISQILISVPLGYANDKTDGAAPFNPDRYTPKYNAVKEESIAEGNAGVGDFTGAATYTYTFDIPKGRRDISPPLFLSYGSQNKNDHNIAGYGWNLSEGRITRSALKGVDTMYSSDEFQFSLFGKTQTLVPKSDGDEGIYVGKYEEDFWKYHQLEDTSWEVTGIDGTVYVFGKTGASRQDDPANETRVYAWILDFIRDTNGNTVAYKYFKAHGNIYPKEIFYTGYGESAGNKKIRFLPFAESSPARNRKDALIDYSPGFRTFNPYRLSGIDVLVDEKKVREYRIDYKEGDNGSRSLLSQITESGVNEGGNRLSLPPVTFDYYESGAKGWEELPISGDVFPNFTSRPRYIDQGTRISDVNGDGYTDFISGLNELADSSVSLGRFVCSDNIKGTIGFNNTQNGFLRTGIGNFPELFMYGGTNTRAPAGTDIVDINGDLYPDIISKCYSEDTLGFSDYQNKLYLHDQASGWETPINFVKPEGELFDINGDSLPDVVYGLERRDERTGTITVSSSVYKNDGKNGFTLTDLKAPGGFTLIDPVTGAQDSGGRFVDINNDGLVDFLRQYDTKTGQSAGLYINTGNGWQHETMPELGGQSNIVAGAAFVMKIFNPLGTQYRDSGYRFVDINGDGLLDIYGARESGTEVLYNGVLLNDGASGFVDPGYEYSQSLRPPAGLVTENGFDMGTRFLDINADGLPDMITEYAADDNASGTQMQRKILINKSEPAVDLLKTVENRYGSTATFAYSPSTHYKNGNSLLNPKLPFAVLTVSQVSYSDGVSNSYSDSYEYEGGHFYFDSPYHKGFYGFGKVKKTDAKGHSEIRYFHQSEQSTDYSAIGEESDHFSKRGKLFRTEYLDKSGKKLAIIISKWTSREQETGRYITELSSTLTRAFEGGAESKDSAVSYEYDEFGNPVTKTEYGQVRGTNDGSFEDIGSDKVITNIAYAKNADKNLYGSTKELTIQNSAGDILRHKRFYYDGLSFGEISKGNVTKQEQIAGDQTISVGTTYDIYGNPVTATDALGNITQIEYEASSTYPAKIINAKNQETRFTYNPIGKVTGSTNASGIETKYFYDPLGRITEVQVPDPSDNLTYKTVAKRSYGDNEHPVSVTQLMVNPDHEGGFRKQVYFYDGFDRQIEMRSETDGRYIVSETLYESNGQLKWKSYPYFVTGESYSSDAGRPGVWYFYDAMKRPVKQTTPLGDTVITYLPWAQETINPEGQKTRSEFDAMGRLIKTSEFLEEREIATRYKRNPLGQITEISDANGNKREFGYDTFGQQTFASEWQRPDATDQKGWSYEYDANGNLTKQTDPKTQTTEIRYDELSRPVSKNARACVGCDPIVTDFTYDEGLYGKGLLGRVTRDGFSESFEYDALSRIVSDTRKIDDTEYVVKTGYDLAGKPKTLTYPDNSEALYSYDRAGRLKNVRFVSGNGNEKEIVKDITYSALSQIESLTYGNDLKTENTYDPAQIYRITEKKTSDTLDTSRTIQSFAYDYDKVGNITEIQDKDADEESLYTYDSLNRLTQAQVASGELPVYTRSYSYDDIGNILTKSDIGSYEYTDANPQIVTKAGNRTYEYDANGNRLFDHEAAYSWDAEDRMKTSLSNGNEILYRYDQNGQRYLKKNITTGEQTVYVGDLFEKEVSRDTSVSRRYIFAGNQRVATVSDDDLKEEQEPVAQKDSQLAGGRNIKPLPTMETLVASAGNLVSSTLLAFGSVDKTPVFQAKLNEGAGTTTKNENLANHIGTVIATWVAGKSGKGLSFNGSNTSVKFPYNSGLNTATNGLTFGGWVYHSANSSYSPRTVLSKKDAFKLSVLKTGLVWCEVTPRSSTAKTIISSRPVYLNTWHQVYCRYDGSKLAVFIDGEKSGETPVSGAVNESYQEIVVGAASFLGAYNKIYYGEIFSGILDELKIYNQSLTDSEMTDLAHEFDPDYPPEPEPVAEPIVESVPEPEPCPAPLPASLTEYFDFEVYGQGVTGNPNFKMLEDFESSTPLFNWTAGTEGAVQNAQVSGDHFVSKRLIVTNLNNGEKNLVKFLSPFAVSDYPWLRFDIKRTDKLYGKITIDAIASDGTKALFGYSNDGSKAENSMEVTSQWRTVAVNLRDGGLKGKTVNKLVVMAENAQFELDNLMLQKEAVTLADFESGNVNTWTSGPAGPIYVKSVSSDTDISSKKLTITLPAGEAGSMELDIPDTPANQFPYLRFKAKRENLSGQGRVLVGLVTKDGQYSYFGWSNNGGAVYNPVGEITGDWKEFKANHRDAALSSTKNAIIDKVLIYAQGAVSVSFDDILLHMHGKSEVIPECAQQDVIGSEPEVTALEQSLGSREEKTLSAPYVYFHHPDHLGSSGITTDENARVVSEVRYFPYGDTRSETGTSANHFKFTDQEREADGIDLYYYGARYYDPAIGRFISNDPLQRMEIIQMQGYAYVKNNPVKYIDPLGLFNVETGEIEKGDKTLKIRDAINEKWGTVYSWGQIYELNKDVFEYGKTLDDLVGKKLIPNNEIPDITQDLTGKMHEYASDWHIINPWFFKSQFNDGGEWDLKSQPGMYCTQAECGGKKYDNYVFDAEKIRYDAPGNILFGYVGNCGYAQTWMKMASSVAGNPFMSNLETLLYYAGKNQQTKNVPSSANCYGDDCSDQYYIIKGYSLWYK